ncbi:MAG: TetR/AcrR family transcriptional regulator [Pseudomonadales bacterium]|nr:TetR/AcrR family transcriptional regulator [Pseudomonadales bacterium]
MATVRARDDDQKLARKHTLMDAGWTLFKENDGQLPSVAQVVKKAGLAKGTFYLYFKTKEELFLELLSDAVKRFFDNIKTELSAETIDVDAVIDTFVKHVSEDEALIHLGCMLSGVIEQNTEEEVLLKFKLHMVQMLFEVGAIISAAVETAIEEGKPYNPIETGVAARLMLRSYAAFVGIAQMVPPPNSPYIDIPELAPVKLDLQLDTKAIVRALWQDALQACNNPE